MAHDPQTGEASAPAALSAEDPTVTDPDNYRTIFENDAVRVLEYTDGPGTRTSPHRHPDSVMYTLSSFRRRLHLGDQTRDVELEAGHAHWLPAQQHAGENIGSTQTHVIFVELKPRGSAADEGAAPDDVIAGTMGADIIGPELSEHSAGVEQS